MTTDKVVPIEDLVKSAIKDAMLKRTELETSASSTSPFVEVEVPSVEKLAFVDLSLKDGQMLLSKLFDGIFSVPKNMDFPVSVFNHEDFHESMHEFIPDIDLTYVLAREHVINVLKSWEAKEKILIFGPTGAGKSSLIHQLCAHTGRPFVRVNSTGDMDSSMIFGNQVARDGATHWVDGVVTECVKHGGVFAWDEWDVTPPEIGMGLQWLLEDKGKLFLKEMPGTSKDKYVIPHKNFLIVALGNTKGQGDETGAHAGTNVQNTATLDRFTTVLCVDYLPEATETKMLMQQFSAFGKETCEKLIKFASLIRQGYTTNQLALTLSPRSLLAICRKISTGYTLANACQLVYFNKLSTTHERVAKELYRKIYGAFS